jgi:extracellular elastinolytic metalloproteinase
VGSDGKIFSFGNNFFTGQIPTENPLHKRAFQDPSAALRVASNTLQLDVNTASASAQAVPDAVETFKLTGTTGTAKEPEARLVYLVKGDGSLVLTWRLETKLSNHWLLTYVDSNSETVHGVVNWVQEATYEV